MGVVFLFLSLDVGDMKNGLVLDFQVLDRILRASPNNRSDGYRTGLLIFDRFGSLVKICAIFLHFVEFFGLGVFR